MPDLGKALTPLSPLSYEFHSSLFFSSTMSLVLTQEGPYVIKNEAITSESIISLVKILVFVGKFQGSIVFGIKQDECFFFLETYIRFLINNNSCLLCSLIFLC